MSRAALEVLALQQENELAVLRSRLAELEGRATRAEFACKQAWAFAKFLRGVS